MVGFGIMNLTLIMSQNSILCKLPGILFLNQISTYLDLFIDQSIYPRIHNPYTRYFAFMLLVNMTRKLCQPLYKLYTLFLQVIVDWLESCAQESVENFSEKVKFFSDRAVAWYEFFEYLTFKMLFM